jgi:hypothetical protein
VNERHASLPVLSPATVIGASFASSQGICLSRSPDHSSHGPQQRGNLPPGPNLTTLPHFSVSSAMNFPNSAGEVGNTVLPRSAKRALILGSARPALISTFLLNLRLLHAGPIVRSELQGKSTGDYTRWRTSWWTLLLAPWGEMKGRGMMMTIVETLWLRIHTVLAAFAEKLAAVGPTLIHNRSVSSQMFPRT